MIAIIEACGSNFASIQFAFERLNAKSIVTNDAEKIKSATHVVLPGVGTAQKAMMRLKQSGLIDLIPLLTQPVLGICVGMQILFDFSEEENTTCLGIIPGRVLELPRSPQHILPHMGWNTIQIQDDGEKNYVYFVHSYAAPVGSYTVATANYGTEFSAIVQNKNFYGVQFHPERSSIIGEKILNNFLSLGEQKL